MADLQINDIISLGIKTKGLEILNNQPFVDSLSDANEFFTDEIYYFLMNSKICQLLAWKIFLVNY